LSKYWIGRLSGTAPKFTDEVKWAEVEFFCNVFEPEVTLKILSDVFQCAP